MVRTQQVEQDGAAGSVKAGRQPAVVAEGSGGTRAFRAVQERAGNGAAVRAMQNADNAAPPPAPGRVLPSYLRDLRAAGLSTAQGLTGVDALRGSIEEKTGKGSAGLADLLGELRTRPEAFFGRGRAATVTGKDGAEYDITLAVRRAPDDRAPVFRSDAGDSTKVDVQHNTAATVANTAGSGSNAGAGTTVFGLAPVAPGFWAGAAATGSVQPWQSSRETRTQRSAAEPRVLRSAGGSVEAERRVRITARVRPLRGGRTENFAAAGRLTQRVPAEHLVPEGIDAAGASHDLDAAAAREVSLADSLAPVGVFDDFAPHEGGGGLFDTVAAVLHPSLTAPGAPGRSALYAATSTATVLEDLPRMLRDGVLGTELHSKDGRTTGSYRMTAAVTALAPAWGTGDTQLRTHQHLQNSTAESAGKGRSVAGGVGPAVGVGAAGNAAIVRATAMPIGSARSARFSVHEQTVSSRQGAEVRGAKTLYKGTVRITAEGIGPKAAEHVLRPGSRVRQHTMDVWLSLRSDEAQALGLPLPPGTEAGEFIKPPGEGAGGERRLPFGAMGSAVTLGHLDTAPMLKAVRTMFATDPQLAGYLPPIGRERQAAPASREEAEAQRDNQRELMAALSETNLRVNKDQLLTTGVRVRLRRKTTLHAHDVQLKVTGALGEARHLGEIDDWLVRSHAGVSANAQTGRGSSRSVGGMVLAQARVVPGALTGSARYDKQATGSRGNQAGPTTRTDVLTNGSEKASAFGAGLRLTVDVTMTSRRRKLARTLTPGMPGREAAEPRRINGVGIPEQDVRLLTPAEFTVSEDEKEQIDAGAERRVPGALRPVGAAGIGDLAAHPPRPSGEGARLLDDWQLVETVGDGQPLRDLALQLLSRAAVANDPKRLGDAALSTEGLAPRLAVEERFSPQSITAAMRQAGSSGWVVKNLRYPRRLAALNGAVGTRLALANPRLLHRGTEGKGPGTETFVLGGHQASGRRGSGTTSSWQGGVSGIESGSDHRVGEGVAVNRTTARGDTRTSAISGTVERNAHTPKKAPLHLVRCDLLMSMVAEVAVNGGAPHAADAAQTVPGAVAVWLTTEQLRAAGLDEPAAAPATEAATETGERSEHRTASAPAPTRNLAARLPLGFGTVENLPEFVPLLDRLRADLAGKNPSLAEELLPRRQLKDRNDNVQRLLRVLDKDGSAGLLSGAMDGGVTVELLDGRRRPYWAVFSVERDGDATGVEDSGYQRDLEYITSAVAQQADSHEESASTGVQAVVTPSGKPQEPGEVKSAGGALAAGAAGGRATRHGSASRGQLGMKSVAEAASTPMAKMRVPIKASLTLKQGSTRYASAELTGATLTHRLPKSDVDALARTRRLGAQLMTRKVRQTREATSERLDAWRGRGVRLPMETQVNGFQGAPAVRKALLEAIGDAGGGARFRTAGEPAAYTLTEAVSTEWLTAALPLLTAAGAELPPVHATGVTGQDLGAALHARLGAGRVLGTGGKMTFETVAQSDLSAPRPSQNDAVSAVSHGRRGQLQGGAGVLGQDFRAPQILGGAGGSGGAADSAAEQSGSMPLHKPKEKSVLVQFDLEMRVVARVSDRVRSSKAATAVRDLKLAHPVVVRMPLSAVQKLVRDGQVTDGRGRLA